MVPNKRIADDRCLSGKNHHLQFTLLKVFYQVEAVDERTTGEQRLPPLAGSVLLRKRIMTASIIVRNKNISNYQ